MAGDTQTTHARFADVPPRTLRKMALFLRAYARTGVILTGCQAAEIARSTFYDWCRRYPAFAMAAGEAQEAAADRLEQEMLRRATEGDRQPVYQGGRLVGFRRQRSDLLLMFALKGARPGKYKEKLLDASDLAILQQRFLTATARLRGEGVVDAQLVTTADGEAPGIEAPAPGTATSSPPSSSSAASAAREVAPAARAPRTLLAAVYAGARRPRQAPCRVGPRPRPKPKPR